MTLLKVFEAVKQRQLRTLKTSPGVHNNHKGEPEGSVYETFNMELI